ncbi:putative transferase CAF17, mitochondrial [Grifola frondosa]|uniref:Putative transferase CAF17, mitochondrial n=1 Tax=Grifola frondosa TaxID=5627 RepID=A0A1C7MMS9_GRIFR|nr:putative transferase CAF17, mitochondrial [Grifola frondosa]
MLPPAVRALVRNTPTVAPIPNRAFLSVTGSHATEFLNGVIAAAVPQSKHDHFFSAILHPQASLGRVLYDVFLYGYTDPAGVDGYLIEYDASPSEAPPFLPMLKRYVLRSKVKLRDLSNDYDVWASWGSEREKSWETERVWNHARSGAIEPVWNPEAEWPWGSTLGVLRDRRAVRMGHRLLVKKGDHPQEVSTHDVAPADAYLLHRILNGVPEGVIDIQPTHAFPMDSNLDIMGGLDFRKGCYVGQELTVRTYHTGIIRKRILPVLLHSQYEKSPFKPEFSPTAPSNIPAHLDIRAQLIRTQNDDTPRPRPRGTGKLLSSTQGVGLALLRLEHVDAVEKGEAKFEVDVGDEKTPLGLTHWWPNWWPMSAQESS